MRPVKLFLALAALVLPGMVSLAQVSTSRLEGTIQDGTGAVVPGAKIEVVNLKTQIRAETTSDAQGRYIFPSLVPSVYRMSVEATGFRKAVREGIELNVGVTLTETVALEVGQVTESVVVEASAVRVQTADSQVARSITLRDIDVLPSLGRAPIALAILSPGVQIDTSDTTYSRVNGARQGSNNTTLDGIQVNDPVAPRFGLVMTGTTTDSVQELQVVTTAGKADLGRNAGGQVQMVTRSGTNSFSGAVWDYHRNTNTNANNFFSNQTGATRPKFIQNVFGGKFAGPIFKDHTFFFGSYDGRRTRQEVVRNRTVLTPEIKQGLFRWKTPGSGAIQSWDIFRNDPRGKGIDPAVKKMVDMLPDPNNFDTGDSLNTGGFRFNTPANSYNDVLTMKFDHNLWDGHHLFFRYSWMRQYSIDTTNSAERTFPNQPDGTQGGRRGGWAIGSDWTVTNTVVNELRVGRQKTNSDFLRPRTKGPVLISNTYTDPLTASFAQGRTVPYIEITDNLSKIHGKHTLKTGINLRFTTQEGWRDDYIWPNVNFTRSYGNVPLATIGPNGSSVIATADRTRFENHYNELLGRVSDVQLRYYSDLEKFLPAGESRRRLHKYHEYGLFVQDDWKVLPRFTVNLGLRYEFFGVPFEANGIQGYLDKQALVNHASRITDFTVKKGGQFYNDDYNNFAPRLGFAWDVKGDGRTAVRGNWGVFYDRMINAVLTPADTAMPGFSADVRPQLNSTAGSDFRYSDGLPAMPQPGAIVLSVPATRTASMTIFNPNLRTGYMMQFGLNVQQELFRNTVVEAGYVGTRGVKMFMQVNLNQPRIYDDFLGAFKELQAYRSNGKPVSANNTLVRIFGSASSAISALGASNFDAGSVSAAANTLDTSNYSRYAAAGIPDTYLRNYPQFTYMYWGTNDGRSYYDSFQLSFRRQQGALKFNANYTFSKSIDNWANEGNGTSSSSVVDSYNLRLNRGLSDYNRPHSLNAYFIYTLPVGRNRRWLSSAPGWVETLLGGWDVGLTSIWQSGQPFSITSGRYTGPNNGGVSYVDITGGRDIGSLDRRGNGVYLFTEAEIARMSFPEAGTIGTSGRNAFRGPRFFNLDSSLLKRFRVAEGKAFTFRVEAYNTFNSARFGTPGNSLGTLASLGKFSGTVGGARTMQMALRFDF